VSDKKLAKEAQMLTRTLLVGWTPLMWATNCSNLPLVSFLLSHGADIEARSSKGATCEDFVLSATPEAGISGLMEAGPSRLPSRISSSSPHTTDRQLIADLIFEHQQAVLKERAEAASKSRGHRLRTMSSSSSQEFEEESYNQVTSISTASSVLGHAYSHSSLQSKTSSTTLRRLVGKNERTMLAEANLRARELAEGRRSALLEVAVMMQVDYIDLVGEAPALSNADAFIKSKLRGRRKADRRVKEKPVHSGLASGCGAIEVGMDPLSMDFDFELVHPDQMLVVGQFQVEALLDRLIREAKPVRAPWIARSKFANVLFLCIRYACSLPDEDLIEDLIFGAVDRIEAVLYAHPTRMTYLAFWLYNSMLLLHYLQRDKTVQQAGSMQEYQALVADLINEIYVFIIRDVERRIDTVLDAAILDHHSISGFEDVRFEGEWSFMKTLTGSVKRGNQSQTSSPASKRPLSQFFAPDVGVAPPSPSNHRRAVSSIFNTPTTPRSTSIQDMREPSHNASASELLARPMPRTITLLLTSTLHILQLYEVNPSVIVQALSQIFYWVGCELFNRVLSQRKYLCKSQAMQIRLNISALEDWVKTNALPLTIVSQHLSKLNQLVSWLLCHSSLVDFDGLIATMQGLKDLNPRQLKEAVRNYRYEVGETRISVECLAYLDQLQVDWEKRYELERNQKDRHGHSRGGTATEKHPNGRHERKESEDVDERDLSNSGWSREPTGEEQTSNIDDTTNSAASQQTAMQQPSPRPWRISVDETAQATQRAIDVLFEPGQSMINYIPPIFPHAKPNTSTLLNSRDMLPFALPSHTQALVVSPGDAFGFGRGHFMGTGTPSLKSFRGSSLLDDGGLDGRGRRNSKTSLSSESSSRCSSSRLSQVSGTSSNASQLYPQGKGLAAGSYWQPVPILPEDTLDEIEELMKKIDQRRKFAFASSEHQNGSSHSHNINGRRASIESRLSKVTSHQQSPNLSLSSKSSSSIDELTSSPSL
jgi:hypothetical protein